MSIEEQVVSILAEYIHVEPSSIAEEASLTEDLGLDSLSIIEFVQSLEESLGIEISDDQRSRAKTVREWIALAQDATQTRQ
jgi:acyl carrier protein